MKKKTQTRQAVVFPSQKKYLTILGENIKLARKRRKLTQGIISSRTGISEVTIRKIEKGDPVVSIGHYLSVLSCMDLSKDITLIARDDELGRKLQDAKMLAGQSRRNNNGKP